MVLDNSPSRENFYLASQKGDKVKVIFFHLSRAESTDPDFKSIEILKDGRFNSTKFRGKRCKLSSSNEHPHVIILSNKKPNIKGLSYKRWRVGYVDKKDSPIVWYKFDENGEEVRLENLDI